MAVRVLVVDDQSTHRNSIKYELDRAGYKVSSAQSGAEALTALENGEFEIALVDYKMANMDGLELLKRVRARWPNVAVVMMTGYPSNPTSFEAGKAGASDFLEKPTRPGLLIETLKKVLAERDRGAGAVPGKGSPFDDLVGRSAAVLQAIELAKTASATEKPVLVVGEYGSGRESTARAIHGTGPRRGGPFVMMRCAGAGPQHDAELFGSQGGPPGGKLVEANGGTIYLEEVGELPADSQAKLLRFLQDGELPRGSTTAPLRSDARTIAATSANLEEEVVAGRFRKDLYLRVKGLVIRLPALRDRLGDLPLLVQHITRKHKARGAPPVRFSKDALAVLATHPFRGNLRELEDVVTQAMALAREGEVGADTLSALGIEAAERGAETTIKNRIELEEKRVIQEELRRLPHNLKQVARNLNISRTTLWRKMKRYGLEAS